jgi:hypothetical protein
LGEGCQEVKFEVDTDFEKQTISRYISKKTGLTSRMSIESGAGVFNIDYINCTVDNTLIAPGVPNN